MTLMSEIREQPETLARQQKLLRPVVERIAKILMERRFDYVYLIARGSSDNAGTYAKYLFGIENRLPTALAAPSMVTAYGAPPRLDRALVISISQSGRSPDLIANVEDARRQGASTVVITNDAQSPLAAASEFVIDVLAGPERAVAATKSYTGQLAAIAMLSAFMANDKYRLYQMDDLPELADKILRDATVVERTAERYRYMNQCVVLGRGYHFATVNEWSLKLKEMTYVVAEPYSSADFRHGPIAVVRKGFPIMAVVSQGAVSDDMMSVLRKLRHESEVELFVVGDSREAVELGHAGVRIPCIPEWLSPILAILPAQLFTYHLTQVKGYDTETPRGLSKVTKTM